MAKLDGALFDEVALRSVAENAPAVEALAREAGPSVEPPRSKPSHDLAALFPMMGRADFERLRASLRERGFADGEEIVLHEGRVLEGRNRLAACEAEGITPRFKEWQGEGGDPLAFVLLKNLDRRHLTPAQAAAAAAKAAPLFAQAARAKSAPVLRSGDESSPGPKKRNEAGRATAQAAQRFGAGQAATKALQGVLRRAPEVHDLALQGRVTVEDAKRLADLPKTDRRRAVKAIKGGAKAKDVLAAEQERVDAQEWEGALTAVFSRGDHVITDQGEGPYLVVSAWTATAGHSMLLLQSQDNEQTLAVRGEPDGPGRTRAVGGPRVIRITKEQAAELHCVRKEERAESVRQLLLQLEQDEDEGEQREQLQRLAAGLRGKSAPPLGAEAQKNLFSSPEPNSAHNVVASQAPEAEAALDAWSQRAKSEGMSEYDQVKLLLHKALALGLSSQNRRVLERILQRPWDKVLLHPYEESALWHVLHAKSDGEGGPGTVLARWGELRARGGDDGEVLRALQKAMGPHGKTTGRFVRVEWRGGRSPEIRLYRIGSEEEPWILQGHELLQATRVMLRIPRAAQGARHAR